MLGKVTEFDKDLREDNWFSNSTDYQYKKNTKYVNSILELCSKSNLLFICLPLNKETKGVVNDACIKLLEDSYIVNISRAEIIDEKLLYSNLKNKHIKGAALDVWYNYPNKKIRNKCAPSNFPYKDLKNIIMSPHAGSHAFNSKEKLIDDIITKINLFLKQNDY